jgi:large exoprotein involved in heme utilization and adhesion
LSVTASDTIELIGTSVDGQIPSSLSAQASGEGDAGDLTIATRRLLVRDGAQVSTGTRSTGRGGTLSVTALDTIELIGTSVDGQIPSGLSAQASGEGRAGNLIIATGQLLMRDGAQVSTGTRSTGRGGTLSVTALDTIELIGTSVDGQIPSGLSAQASGEGDAGNLRIVTGQLLVRDGAEVNVSSLRAGIVGILQIEAGYILLDNGGKLQAESAFGKGGNILLDADLLLLRRNSLISAVNGNEDSNGIGGNIFISTQFLVAVPKENSDIVATGYGRSAGSNIQVNAQSIFGTQFREQLTSHSDIVATGTVELNIPDVDPNRGLTNLPTEVVDASNQIAQTCGAGRREARENKFIVTGSGGMAPHPYEPLSPNDILGDPYPPTGFSSPSNSKPVTSRTVTSQSATSNPKPPIVEAQGWITNDKGQVVLTATASTSTPNNSWLRSATCPSS